MPAGRRRPADGPLLWYALARLMSSGMHRSDITTRTRGRTALDVARYRMIARASFQFYHAAVASATSTITAAAAAAARCETAAVYMYSAGRARGGTRLPLDAGRLSAAVAAAAHDERKMAGPTIEQRKNGGCCCWCCWGAACFFAEADAAAAGCRELCCCLWSWDSSGGTAFLTLPPLQGRRCYEPVRYY